MHVMHMISCGLTGQFICLFVVLFSLCSYLDLICSHVITSVERDRIPELVRIFQSILITYYSLSNSKFPYTINMHFGSHYREVIESCGLLRSIWVFAFENTIQFLKKILRRNCNYRATDYSFPFSVLLAVETSPMESIAVSVDYSEFLHVRDMVLF